MFHQEKGEVLIRQPGGRKYGPPADVSETAGTFWTYAVLSENVYIGNWKKPCGKPPEQTAQILKPPAATPEAYKRCCESDDESDERELLPLSGWKMWEDFPSAAVIQEARQVGLYVEVWEKEASPAMIAVVFRGTDASWSDWMANLRWFLWFPLRFIPFYEDQYTVLAQHVGKEFVDRIGQWNTKNADSEGARVIATGHSLGGGLAQHFAYSLPGAASNGVEVPRVSHVYAFDPSPVTGWSSVDDKEQRTVNASGLKIDRIFEHGEFLAYIRLLLGYVYPPPSANPSVRELRYNFVLSANPFKNHSMRLLACALIHYSGQTCPPDQLE